MKLSHRQRLDEGRPHLRRDHEKPVRLAVIGGEFREELVVGDSGRSVETGLDLDLLTDPKRDIPGQRNALQVFGNVKIGFVE